MNLRAIFHWQFSGVLFPLFYGSGLAFWSIGLSSDPYKPLFLIAAIFVTCGFLWSVGWLSASDIADSWAEHQPFFKRTIRFWLLYGLSLLCLAVPFCATSIYLHKSYVARAAEKDYGSVEVFFGDSVRQPAVKGKPFDPTNLRHIYTIS